jgi:epoxyqueuosine reductase QueG
VGAGASEGAAGDDAREIGEAEIGEAGIGEAEIGRIVAEGGVDRWGAAVNDPPLPLAPSLPTAISLVMRFRPSSLEGVAESGPNETYYREYCRLNETLDAVGGRLVALFRERGWRAELVPATLYDDEAVEDWGRAGVFPHKTAATQAGLGWIGKTALFVSLRLGPKVRLATVFTDLRVPPGIPLTSSRCGKCRLCVDACPVGAGRDVLWQAGMPRDELYDEKACEVYTERFPELGGVCGICVAACPLGKRE